MNFHSFTEKKDKENFSGKVRSSARGPSAESRSRMMVFLRYEYKIYNFVKAHFAKQYQSVMEQS